MKPQCRHVHIWTRAQAWAPCPATNTTSPPLIRLQWPLFIASGPWQHVGPLPMTGSSVPALVSQFWARVFFGLPGFLLSGGVHLQAPFVMRSCSILNTCPSHLRPRNLLGDAPASRFLIQVIVGDLIRPKDLAYSSEASIMEHFHSLMTVPTTRQLSEPYSRPDFTLLLYRSIFVLRLYCLIHMGWEIKPWV